MAKIGVCIVGLNGGVSTTSITAASALGKNLIPLFGLYTETQLFDDIRSSESKSIIKNALNLVDFKDVVFAGWDIEKNNVYNSALKLKIVPKEVLEKLPELANIKAWPGIFSKKFVKMLDGHDIIKSNLYEQANEIMNNINDFKKEQSLETVIVINLSSTEIYQEITDVHQTLEAFEKGMKINDSRISPGQIYAYAAVKTGSPYINFTPSLTAEIPAILKLAEETKVPIAGKDGKTGQTLLKTALAPIFKYKNLYVAGWFSTNILGNKDGFVLSDPESFEAKRRTKAGVLRSILNYDVDPHIVKINYYPPRGDEKEAWDNIDILGVFGEQMQIKINFLCKDSILATGNVLDLIRLIHKCKQLGLGGFQEQLSFFFKSPYSKTNKPIHDFFKQESMLRKWLMEAVKQHA